MGVNSALVAHEVLVDGEASLDGTAGNEASLDGGRGAVLLDVSGLVELGAVGRARAGLVIVTRAVGVAGVGGNTVRLEVLPDSGEVATAAAVVGLVAGYEPLGGEDYSGGGVGVDAGAVSQHFSGGEGPARSTVTLVADGANALGPLGTSVEGGGDGEVLLKSAQLGYGVIVLGCMESHELLGLAHSHVADPVEGGSPGPVGVHVVNHLLGHDRHFVLETQGRPGEEQNRER